MTALQSYNSTNPGSSIVVGGPRSFYEINPTDTTDHTAPPTAFAIDFSNLGSTHLGLGHLADAVTYLRRSVEFAERGNPASFWSAAN